LAVGVTKNPIAADNAIQEVNEKEYPEHFWSLKFF
jgi:hypothetical protein